MGENALAHQYGTDVLERLMDAGACVPDFYRAFPEEMCIGEVMLAGECRGLDLGMLFCQSPTTAGIRLLASATT